MKNMLWPEDVCTSCGQGADQAHLADCEEDTVVKPSKLGMTKEDVMSLTAQVSGLKGFDIKKLDASLAPWEKNPKRADVAVALRELFPDSLVTIGGRHVAAHNPITGNQMIVITGSFPDWT